MKENVQRDKEKEKNLRKREFFQEKFFPEKSLFSKRKFSFPRENSLFTHFSLKLGSPSIEIWSQRLLFCKWDSFQKSLTKRDFFQPIKWQEIWKLSLCSVKNMLRAKNNAQKKAEQWLGIELIYSWRRVIKHENGSIGCVRTIRILQKSRKSIGSGLKLKKIIFSGKNLFWKNSLFSWNFSCSLEIFLFFSGFLSLSYFSLEINWNEIHL